MSTRSGFMPYVKHVIKPGQSACRDKNDAIIVPASRECLAHVHIIVWFHPQVIPTVPHNFLTSGVYKLLSEGELPTSHHDHPVTRRPATAAAGQPKSSPSAMCTAPLTSSGIHFQSVYLAACG
eukprot:scaffold129204_cov15-Tisochrysis_lutea.AAC.1